MPCVTVHSTLHVEQNSHVEAGYGPNSINTPGNAEAFSLRRRVSFSLENGLLSVPLRIKHFHGILIWFSSAHALSLLFLRAPLYHKLPSTAQGHTFSICNHTSSCFQLIVAQTRGKGSERFRFES
jgi:hypothetical protein